MNRLTWIAVPDGRISATSPELRLRVAILPQLESATLGEAGMAQWPPPELAMGHLVADVAAAPDAETIPVNLRLTGVPDAGLWSRFFLATTPIRRNDQGADDREYVVRSLSGDGAAAERIYRHVSAANVDAAGTHQDDYAAAVREALDAHPIAPPDAVPPAAVVALTPLPPPDFHDIVGLLREHPTVMRALGLVLECSLDPTHLPASGVLRIRWPDMPGGLPALVSPWTAYEMTADWFAPASTAEIVGGMVAITNSALAAEDTDGVDWRVHTVDVETSATRLYDVALAARTGDDDAKIVFPALKTGGVTLARIDLADHLTRRRNRLAAHRTNGAAPVLTADDMVLGYRIDVRRDNEDWKSLMARTATYTIGDGVPVGTPDGREEGHLKHAAAADYGDRVLRTDDVVARWTGWSLAVKHPRLDGSSETESRRVSTDAPLHGFDFAFRPQAGSLPRLRFGSIYRVRIRVADIAGGGLALDDPAADRLATTSVLFGRYEPIGSPVLTLPAGIDPVNLGPAEGMFDLVVRSDRDMDAPTFAAQNPRYAVTPTRCIQPPQVAVSFAEQHKMFDRIDDAASWTLAQPVLTGNAETRTLHDPAASGVAAFLNPGTAPLHATQAWPRWPVVGPKQLTLNAGGNGTPPKLSWNANTLLVSVAQGESHLLELSSSMQPDFPDHFAAWQTLSSTSNATTAALDGRHPLLTPAQSLRVTHAVRKPMKDPSGKLDPVRGEAQTYTELTPSLPLCGVHAPSTATLQITASWSEPTDEQEKWVQDAPVGALTLDPAGVAAAQPLLHQFGDTKHRTVVYKATAISRYRRYFAKEDPDDAFVATTTFDAIDIPSAARPPAPVLMASTPAFRLTEQRNGARIVRQRDCFLRMQLARPWFASGSGEQLGIVLASTGAGADAAPLDLLSQIGRDPIWMGDRLPRTLALDAFAPSGPDAKEHRLAENGAPVAVVPFDVWFDTGCERWCADVLLHSPQPAIYAPMVRLALARYQPCSVGDLHLSRVTLSDFVPLLPLRTLQADLAADSVTISLAGTGPTGTPENQVRCILERNASGAPDDAASLLTVDPVAGGWQSIAESSGGLGQAQTLHLPPGTDALRIRVIELEQIPSAPGVDVRDELSSRVVFLDTVRVRV